MPLIIVIGGIALLFLANKAYQVYTVVNSSTFKFAGIRDMAWHGSFPDGKLFFNLVADTDNPSKSSLKLDKVDLKIWDVNRKLLSEINQEGSGFEILPKSKQQIEVPIAVDGNYIFHEFATNAIVQLINIGRKKSAFADFKNVLPKEVWVEGSVRVAGIPIPVNQKLNVFE